MTQAPENVQTPGPGTNPEGSSSGIKLSLFSLVLTLGVIFYVVALLVGQGWLPPDDARRHVALALHGGQWSEILVVGDSIPKTMDTHPGWHDFFLQIPKLLGAEKDGLMVFSLVFCWCVFALSPLLIIRCPQAAPLALAIILALDPGVIQRMLMGRPMVLTAGLTIALLAIWEMPAWRKHFTRGDWRVPGDAMRLLITVLLLTAIGVWVQSTWYLFALPVLAVLLDSRRVWPAKLWFALMVGGGVLAGAGLTGQPIQHLLYQVDHLSRSLNSPLPRDFNVTEFQSYLGSWRVLLVLLLLFGLNRWRTLSQRKLPEFPAPLALALIGGIAGAYVVRFWSDWGAAAAYLLLCMELQTLLSRRWFLPRAVQISTTIFATALLALLSHSQLAHLDGREARRLNRLQQELALHPGVLPEPGGIIYASSMTIFFDLFYLRPEGEWRYQIGFEPGLMPDRDLQILARIAQEQTLEPWQPWVQRMRPKDRLIFAVPSPRPPAIHGLEWGQVKTGQWWVGRIKTPPESLPGE